MKTKLYFFLFIIILLYNNGYADTVLPAPYKKHKIYILSDNDAYILPLSDKYYTAGQRIGYTSREWDFYNEDTVHKMAWLKKVSFFPQESLSSFNININQEIYTPEDKSLQPDANDYNYAGGLYLSFGINQRRGTSLERMQLQVGVVGKYSFAQDVQNGIHSSVNSEHNTQLPWINQVGDEVIVNFLYSYTGRIRMIHSNPVSMYLIPTGQVSLGNGLSYLDLNTRVQIGHNLDVSFGPSKITYGADTIGIVSDDFTMYVYGGMGYRFNIRNVYIQGNTGVYPYRHRLEPFLLYFEAGFAIANKGFEISYGVTHKFREYKLQQKHHTYGTILISFAI